MNSLAAGGGAFANSKGIHGTGGSAEVLRAGAWGAGAVEAAAQQGIRR